MQRCRAGGSPGRGRRPRWLPSLVAVGVVLVAPSACGSPGEAPPVAALGPPATARSPADDGGAGHRPAGPDICDLARDPRALADVERWAHHIPALEAALPAEVDVAAALGGLAPETPATPSVMTRLDVVWDLLDERCRQDPLVARCRSLIAIALADPIGWAVRAPDAGEVEAAFRLAVSNWTDLRQRVVGDQLRRAVDAHMRFLTGASEALAAVAWEPGRVDVLEPLAGELVALGEPEVVDPLYELEASCGFG